MEDTQRRATRSSYQARGFRRFPQELYNMIIDNVPGEALPQCCLVCKDWVRLSSRRLFDDFSWPPKSIYPLRLAEIPGRTLSDLFKLLVASSRLQDAIRALRLGHCSDAPSGAHPTYVYPLNAALLISIVNLCPRLTDLTLAYCRLRPAYGVIERGRLRTLETFSLTCCSMAHGKDTQGILEILSSFTRINTLAILNSKAACPSYEPPMPLPQSLELKCIDLRRTYNGGQLRVDDDLRVFKHIEAISNFRTSLRSVVLDTVSVGVFAYLQHLSSLQSLTYKVDSENAPAVGRLTSLRRITMCGTNFYNRLPFWSNIMRDIEHLPSHLQFVTISVEHIYLRSHHNTIDILYEDLSAEDWKPLETFIERCSSVTVELQIWCTAEGHGRMPTTTADPDSVEKVVRALLLKCLSETASRAISVRSCRPPSRL